MSCENSANKHWLLQRASAVALIPLSFFTVYKILSLLSLKESFFTLLYSPFSLLLVLLFILLSLYHASLGVEEILEDYVKSNSLKIISNAFIKFFNLASVIFLGIAIICGYYYGEEKFAEKPNVYTNKIIGVEDNLNK